MLFKKHGCVCFITQIIPWADIYVNDNLNTEGVDSVDSVAIYKLKHNTIAFLIVYYNARQYWVFGEFWGCFILTIKPYFL